MKKLIPVILVLLGLTSQAPAQNWEPRTILVGSEIDYAPYAMTTETGEADGFSVDLIKAVAQVMGLRIKFRVAPWNEVRQALENGELDALPLVSHSEERERVFDFTMTHTKAHGVIFIRKDGKAPQSVEELKGQRIVVMNADATHDWLVENQISDDLVVVDTVTEALRLVAAGAYEMALAPRLVGLIEAKKLGLTNLAATDLVIETHGRGYGFAVRKGDHELLQILNEGLAIIRNTGQYDEIYAKWFGEIDPDLDHVAWTTVIRYAVAGTGLLILVVGGFLFWNLSLRRLVAIRTASLQASEANQHRMIDALGEGGIGLLVIDRDYRVRFMNQPLKEMFGDITGRICHEGLGGGSETCDYCRLGEVIDQGRTVRYQPTLPDGRSFDVTAVPIRNDDGSISKLEVVREITDQVNAARERELMVEELTRLNAELKVIARVSAHHLQEPSRRMVTYAQKLRQHMHGDLEAVEDLEVLETNARRSRDLARDMERYLSADMARGPAQVIDAEEMLRGMTDHFWRRLKQYGGDLEIIPPLPMAEMDEPRLRDIFEILIDNAIVHGHGEKPLLIRISGKNIDGMVRYRLEDNGPGIPEKYRERVFRLFEKLDGQGDGTGIGLPIVRRIVESIGGKVGVEEGIDGGTAIVLELPDQPRPR